MWHKRLTGTEISKKKGRMHIWTMADNKEEFRVSGSERLAGNGVMQMSSRIDEMDLKI